MHRFYQSILPGAFLALTLSLLAAPAVELNLEDSPPDRSNSQRLTSYADVLAKVTPAVVGVYTSQLITRRERSSSGNPFEDFLREYYGFGNGRDPKESQEMVPSGVGSGVIVSKQGYVLTNNHVVTQQGAVVDKVVVKLTDGREFDAEVVGTDAATDIAVLKVEGDKLPVATLANSENLLVGDVVFAIGNPLGVGLTVTMGIVSATERTNLGLLGMGGYENFIQTDASINVGNSGGALVDAEGRLVGINTAIMSRSGGNIGLGFAIPMNLARNVMISLVEKGVVERGAIGVLLESMSQDKAESLGWFKPKGALVRTVVPGKAGDKAGLKNGDIILKVNGREIDNFAQLRLIISQKRPGTKVKLAVLRGKKEMGVNVTLGSLGSVTAKADNPEDWPIPGLDLETLTPEFRKEYSIPGELQGVVVSSIHKDYDYEGQIVSGTVICEINGTPSTLVSKVPNLLRPGVNRLYVWHKKVGFRFIAIRL